MDIYTLPSNKVTKKPIINNNGKVVGIKVTINVKEVQASLEDGDYILTGSIVKVCDTDVKGNDITDEYDITFDKFSMTKTFYKNKIEKLYIMLEGVGGTAPSGEIYDGLNGAAIYTVDITEIDESINIYGFDERKNKIDLTDIFINEDTANLKYAQNSKVISKGDIGIAEGYISIANGSGTTSLTYPNGFSKDNCVILSFMARQSDNNSSLGYGYLEEATGYVGGAIGHMVRLLDDVISVNVNNPAEHTNGNKSYMIDVVLLKIN